MNDAGASTSAAKRKYPYHLSQQPTAFRANFFARKKFGAKAVVWKWSWDWCDPVLLAVWSGNWSDPALVIFLQAQKGQL
ncbi:MAG: hypothetical protein DRR19_15245 [Candidatus Parabeggiatoa sp. nov. 1]|nr:MAG: hypothetical protein DRR19_15245 [Gammaproteobacteria bacterium]